MQRDRKHLGQTVDFRKPCVWLGNGGLGLPDYPCPGMLENLQRESPEIRQASNLVEQKLNDNIL